MPSITSWIRLEPGARSDDETVGLEARIHDPLWLLGRQWQMGEFQGSDGGSPVVARLRAESALLTRYSPGPPGGPAQGILYDGRTQPLETLVEREAVRAPERLLLSVDAGLHFLRLLKQRSLSKSYRAAYVDRYPVAPLTPEQRSQLDSGSIRSFAMLAGRVPHGDLLYADLRGQSPRLPAEPLIAKVDVPAVEAAAAECMRFRSRRGHPPGSGRWSRASTSMVSLTGTRSTLRRTGLWERQPMLRRNRSRARLSRRQSRSPGCLRRGGGSSKTRRWISAAWMQARKIWRACC
jgi:hypothetical protein